MRGQFRAPRLADLGPMIDKFTADTCDKTPWPEADLNPFPGRGKLESPILRKYRRAVVGHWRRLVSDSGLIEILSDRVDDPFAIFIRTEPVAADRRFRRYRAIAAPDE